MLSTKADEIQHRRVRTLLGNSTAVFSSEQDQVSKKNALNKVSVLEVSCYLQFQNPLLWLCDWSLEITIEPFKTLTLGTQVAITQTCPVSRFYDLSHALMSWQLISHDFYKTQTPKKKLELLGSFPSLIDINR